MDGYSRVDLDECFDVRLTAAMYFHGKRPLVRHGTELGLASDPKRGARFGKGEVWRWRMGD